MPILADLSRRLHLLTTDSKPDPPRSGIDGYTNNLPSSPSDTSEKSCRSAPATNVTGEIREDSPDRRQTPADGNSNDRESSSLRNDDTSNGNEKNSRETKNPRFRTKIPYKAAQTANIVNYHIVNSNGIKIGATKTYVCNVNQCTKNTSETSDGTTKRGKTRIMPKKIVELCMSEREITLEDIFVMKTHMGHGWRDVFRRLGYSEGQLDQFEENHRGKGIDEVIYQAFLDWKRANTKDAKIGALTSVLWSCREYDCAERLAADRKTPT